MRHEHGTWRRYHAGCGCRPCTTAWSRYAQRCKARRALGTSRLVDPAPAYRRIAGLVDEHGVSPYRCWEAAGASPSWARSLAYTDEGDQWLDRRLVTAAKALTIDDVDGGALVDNDEAKAAYRQLVDDGWMQKDIAVQVGCSVDVLRWYADKTTLATTRALQTLADGRWVRCVECGGDPYLGGKWCLPCLDDYTDGRRSQLSRMKRRARYGISEAA